MFEHSGRCLTVPGNSSSNATSLNQQTCNGSESQEFQLVEEGAAVVLYTGTTSSQVVDSHGSTDDIIQWPENGGSNQRWRLLNRQSDDSSGGDGGDTAIDTDGDGLIDTEDAFPASFGTVKRRFIVM